MILRSGPPRLGAQGQIRRPRVEVDLALEPNVDAVDLELERGAITTPRCSGRLAVRSPSSAVSSGTAVSGAVGPTSPRGSLRGRRLRAAISTSPIRLPMSARTLLPAPVASRRNRRAGVQAPRRARRQARPDRRPPARARRSGRGADAAPPATPGLPDGRPRAPWTRHRGRACRRRSVSEFEARPSEAALARQRQLAIEPVQQIHGERTVGPAPLTASSSAGHSSRNPLRSSSPASTGALGSPTLIRAVSRGRGLPSCPGDPSGEAGRAETRGAGDQRFVPSYSSCPVMASGLTGPMSGCGRAPRSRQLLICGMLCLHDQPSSAARARSRRRRRRASPRPIRLRSRARPALPQASPPRGRPP